MARCGLLGRAEPESLASPQGKHPRRYRAEALVRKSVRPILLRLRCYAQRHQYKKGRGSFVCALTTRRNYPRPSYLSRRALLALLSPSLDGLQSRRAIVLPASALGVSSSCPAPALT